MGKLNRTPIDFLVPGASDTLPGAPDAGKVRLYGAQIGGKPVLYQRAPNGRALPIQTSFAKTRIAWANPRGDVATIDTFGLSISTTGTLTAGAVNNTSFYKSQRRVDALVTSASTTAVAGFRWNQSQWYRGDAAGRGGFLFCCRFGFTTGVATSTTRGYCGLASATGAPTDVDPSGQNNVLGFGWDSGDTNISFMHKTGAGSVVKETLAGGAGAWTRPSVNEAAVFDVSIYCAPNGSVVEYEITNLTSGATTRSSTSSDLPASTTLLCPKMYISVGGTSSVIGMSLFNLYIESDT